MEREDWPVEFRGRDSPGILCSWAVMWYLCSLNYFPHGFYLSLFPDFTPLLPRPPPDVKKPKSKSLSFVDVRLTLAELKLSVTQNRTRKIQEELVLAALTEHKRACNSDIRLSDDDSLLYDSKCVQYRLSHIEFLKFMERQERAHCVSIEVDDRSGFVPTRTPLPKTTVSPQCQVCGEKDTRDDDQLVQCSVSTLRRPAKCRCTLGAMGWKTRRRTGTVTSAKSSLKPKPPLCPAPCVL